MLKQLDHVSLSYVEYAGSESAMTMPTQENILFEKFQNKKYTQQSLKGLIL